MAIFRKRKIGFELKTDINRKLLVHCKLRNINILRDVFQKTCPFFSLFQLYIETCFLACLCLSSFAPRDVRGELFSDCEIARSRSCEIAREKHQLKITTVSVAERPNAVIGGTVGGAACRVSSVRVRPETPFFEPTT